MLCSMVVSYKFLRLFPLSQDDLPTTKPILPFPTFIGTPPFPSAKSGAHGPTSKTKAAAGSKIKGTMDVEPAARIMALHHEQLNPEVSGS